jgi:predicted Fe-Mo cluster-binding NifX family protein
MKIAISATAPDLSAQVDPRFGRCQYFVIVDPDSMEFEGIENSSASASGGAGIAAAQLIVGKEVAAVLTGNCGPNAFNVLEAAGIKVMTGVSGTVKEAVTSYKAGKYNAISQANVSPHSGMGRK